MATEAYTAVFHQTERLRNHHQFHLASARDAEAREFRHHTHTNAHAPEEAELHFVIVPYPLQGHINPMMQFAKTLINKHGARVTFVNNKQNHDRIQRVLATASTQANTPDERMTCTSDTHLQGHIDRKIQFVWLDNGLPPDFDCMDMSLAKHKELHIATFTMEDPFKQLLQSLKPPASCVLFESFCPWAHSVAVELGIPSIFFWTQSTSVFSMYYHAPLLAANGFFPYDKKNVTGCTEDGAEHQKASDYLVSYVPGVPPLPPSSFPTLLHIDDLSNPLFQSIRNQFSILKDCKGVIINSFEELDMEAYQAVQSELSLPVYLVGPLIPSAFLDRHDKSDTRVGASLLQEEHACIIWLDKQKKHSVLYVSFGSICSPSSEDLEVIACGIRSSKQPFLWVIRARSSLEKVCDILPKNFLEDTKEYGLIIPWAPQLQVLSHSSVGAFLTHGGWNSTLESLSMGVPMITFPIFSDQTTNCTYVCEFWKLGMPLKRQVNATVKSKDVESVVRTVLREEEGCGMRKRAWRLKEAARQAMLTGGSSSKHRELFIQRLETHVKAPI